MIEVNAGLLLAFLWGAAIAVFMRSSWFGRFMAENMMWFIVACGAGVDLLIIYEFFTVNGMVRWLDIVYVFFWSALVIAGWSLYDLSHRFEEVIRGLLNQD